MAQPILSSRQLIRLIHISPLLFLLATSSFADTLTRGAHAGPKVSSATYHRAATPSSCASQRTNSSNAVHVNRRHPAAETAAVHFFPLLILEEAMPGGLWPGTSPVQALSLQVNLPLAEAWQQTLQSSRGTENRLEVPTWLACFSPTFNADCTNRPILLLRLQKRW